MRVAAYYRVSSGKQKKDHTVDSQRTAVRALCAARGWELVAEFTDEGASARSGKLHKRPDFAAMLAGARAHEFAAVILVAFDRLTRSVDLTELGTILGTLQAAGVVLYSDGGEAIDLNTFGGRINALVRAQLAAEESVIKSDRARRGRDRVARAGRPPGTTPWALHFDKVTGTWGEVAGPAAVVREAWARSAAGESNVTIAIEFSRRNLLLPRGGAWHHSVVARLLQNEVYTTGKWVANPGVVVDVPVLVDAATAAAARETLRRNRTTGPKVRRGVYILEGIASCSDCGSKMMIYSCTGKGHRYNYYVCKRKRHARFYGDDACSSPMYPIAATDERVWLAVSDWLARPDLMSRFIEERAGTASAQAKQALADLRDWQTKLAAVPALEAQALELSERGLLSSIALAARLADLLRRRRLLEQQVATAEAVTQGAHLQLVDVEALERTLVDLRGRCLEATPEQRRGLVRALCPEGWTVSPTAIEADAVFCPGAASGVPKAGPDQNVGPAVAVRARLTA